MPDATSPPPLDLEAAKRILSKLQPELDAPDGLVLIGGQAVLLWQEILGGSTDPGAPVTSADVDLATEDRGVVHRCARLLGGRVVFPEPFDPTPTFAIILFDDEDGQARQLDLVASPLGLDIDDVRATAIPVELPAGSEDASGLKLYVLHPERMLEGRTASLATLRGDRVAVEQLRSAVRSCRRYTHALLESAATPESKRVKAAVTINERVFKLACGIHGRDVYLKHGVDVLEAAEATHTLLPAKFREQDWPNKVEQARRKRAPVRREPGPPPS